MDDRNNLAILNFSATIELLKKRRERSAVEFVDGRQRFSALGLKINRDRNSDYSF